MADCRVTRERFLKRPDITTIAVDAAVVEILAATDKTFCEYEAKPLLAAYGI